MDQSPAEVHATLLEQQTYLCSPRTMYRVLAAAGEVRGRVVAKPVHKRDLNAAGLKRFITQHVKSEGTILMTDEYKGYRMVGKVLQHAVVKHKERYVDGLVHTNTIEAFWALIKRAFHGTHHHYSQKWAWLYIAEQCASFNDRKAGDRFDPFLKAVVA